MVPVRILLLLLEASVVCIVPAIGSILKMFTWLWHLRVLYSLYFSLMITPVVRVLARRRCLWALVLVGLGVP